ncbi:DUF4310 family protein [Providencia rettgeri]|uniref:DUF4310 family protein n=1 Tax=Providencia rettgeri TaxID=587 RepID=UPI002893DBD4|nr:DUF4310 family protein [Providencia rettgeri]ELM3937742.1 DUF4310 family protein [Providencia rettgeri]EMA4645120.1 DUF4310 family protein [Providencia rettgeri]WRR96503.1 DUF4310 family protein [Providencia rettgeri]
MTTEINKQDFWYAEWSFPIFVGLLSAGIFAGTHMYVVYGFGAFNEVAFVAMLRAGLDTGVYGAVAAFGASFLFARIIEGSLVDAGSVGADDIDKFYQLTQKSKTNVFSLLNISRIGIIAQNELSDMNNINDACFQDAIERHSGFVVGMKARMSKSVVGENGIAPLIKAKEMQKKHHLPLMVHIGNNPPDIDEVADLLTRGDIITHCFNGKPNKILGEDGYLKPSIARALARGVILDVGHGGESFSFKVAEQAMRIGTYPDIISSDIYHRNRVNGPVYSLAFVMTKFLCMGFSAEQVLRCVTEKAANFLSLPAKGYLRPGFDADITLFDLKEEQTELTDAEGEHRIGTHRFVPLAAIVGGKHIIHAQGESEHAIDL